MYPRVECAHAHYIKKESLRGLQHSIKSNACFKLSRIKQEVVVKRINYTVKS